MSADPETEYLAALIDLHRGLPRQGPGDAEFTRALLRRRGVELVHGASTSAGG